MLRCSIRFAQDKAQHDSSVTQTDALINVFICIKHILYPVLY